MICDICKEDIEFMDIHKMRIYDIRRMNICVFCSIKQYLGKDYMLLYKNLLQKQKLERKALLDQWNNANFE